MHCSVASEDPAHPCKTCRARRRVCEDGPDRTWGGERATRPGRAWGARANPGLPSSPCPAPGRARPPIPDRGPSVPRCLCPRLIPAQATYEVKRASEKPGAAVAACRSGDTRHTRHTTGRRATLHPSGEHAGLPRSELGSEGTRRPGRLTVDGSRTPGGFMPLLSPRRARRLRGYPHEPVTVNCGAAT